jgi:protein-S-isoprenylcysteine O-methyltransferase Ste14
MPWIRGLIFTLLIPGIVGGWAPYLVRGGRHLAGGLWQSGWAVLTLGVVFYLWTFASFLAAGGTPAAFFTRHFRAILGEEPARLVRGGLYRFSRNPMYTGVTLAIFGQAILFASGALALYGLAVWVSFHAVVVFLEEPHLRARHGPAFDEYRRQVPRWLGLGSPHR